MGRIDFEAGRHASAKPQSPLLSDYRAVREASVRLASPLSAEDQTVQSMPDASPTKWHLAHTTWFFETFILAPTGAAPFDLAYGFLFNSYYNALGERHPRPQRGLLTRPSRHEVGLYRAHVDAAIEALLDDGRLDAEAQALVVLGLAHEEQHQELILTDILSVFAQNMLKPAYRNPQTFPSSPGARPMGFVDIEGGIVEIGHSGDGFCFDNEQPRHRNLLRPFKLADRLTTNAEWLEFMADDGYARPEFWLSDGWAKVVAEGWSAPHYWQVDPEPGGQGWLQFTLEGLRPLELEAPVVHVSFYEADAYARWRGLRLPTEVEWEHAARDLDVEGVFLEDGRLRPAPAGGSAGLRQMFGDAWEWTASPYSPYPGYRPAPGAVGEYNGKFMINQMVLRGGSCVTSRRHMRASYRNFFQPHQRWQFTGVRLAQDA